MTLPTNRTERAHTILQRAVCLTLECHYLGNDRKIAAADIVRENARRKGGDAAADVTVEIDEEAFRAVMRLVDPTELRPARRQIALAKAFLRSRAVSAHKVFGERSYLIPDGLVEEVDTRLTEIQAAVAAEGAALAVRYAAAIERQKAALGELFNEKLYPTVERVATAFAIDWSYVSFEAPDKLETISAALARKANAKHKDRLADAFDEVVVGLRATALDVVATLDERLEPEHADGRRKGIRADALDALNEFVTLLPHLNMAGDDALTAAMNRLRDRAAGVTAEQLKTDDALRASLREVAAGVKATLSGLVEEGPRRGIRLPGPASSAA